MTCILPACPLACLPGRNLAAGSHAAIPCAQNKRQEGGARRTCAGGAGVGAEAGACCSAAGGAAWLLLLLPGSSAALQRINRAVSRRLCCARAGRATEKGRREQEVAARVTCIVLVGLKCLRWVLTLLRKKMCGVQAPKAHKQETTSVLCTCCAAESFQVCRSVLSTLALHNQAVWLQLEQVIRTLRCVQNPS